jgi:hypothetical protein
MFRKAVIFSILIFGLSFMGCATVQKSGSGMSSTGKSKQESVEELLALSKADAALDAAYGQMDQLFVNMGKQLGVKPEEQEMFDKFMLKMASLMKEEMSWDKMKGPMIEIYLKHYTEKEVQDMITFYKSESGRSMISKQADVAKDTMMLSQKMIEGFLPKVMKLSQEMEAELAAKRK